MSLHEKNKPINNAHARGDIANKKLEIIQACFQKVSNLIRNSPPTEYDENGKKIHVSDSTRLKLYGFYKCATATRGGDDDNNDDDYDDVPDVSKRPSLFDPVGRAKFDAWVECHRICNGDAGLAMEKYVEVAAGQHQTTVGRQSGDIYREAMESMEQLDQSPSESVSADEKSNIDKSLSEENVGDVVANKPALITAPSNQNFKAVAPRKIKEKLDNTNKNSSNNKNSTTRDDHNEVANRKLPSWITSFLPKPLIPRGQLDISFLDLLFALYHCIHHAIYATFLGGGIVHRFLTFLLPSFAMALINISFSSFHPRQRAEKYEGLIVKRWLEMDHESCAEVDNDNRRNKELVVGLSVRSLFDLYLSTQSYPAGSEVVIVPPVNIPGMVDVMLHHDLVLVPVDVLGAEETTLSRALAGGKNEVSSETFSNKEEIDDATNTNDQVEKDSFENCVSTRWGIDLDAVKGAITDKTVAIFVVHPFGTVIANQHTMMQMREIADRHSLDLWEDCAQCYTGKSNISMSIQSSDIASREASPPSLGYMGSNYSNVSFFSFGPIKTATALGGGLAVLGSPKSQSTVNVTTNEEKQSNCATEIAIAMRRKQDTMFEQQSNCSYFIRILTCFGVHLASQSSLMCGAVKSVIEKLGLDYDDFVVSALRGFSTSASSSDDQNRSGDFQRKALISQLRRRPCPALLALLHRRLEHSASTENKVRERLRRCQIFAKQISNLMSKYCPNNAPISFPERTDGSQMHGWLFPILVRNPFRLSKKLLDLGFDVPRGMTQLKPVPHSNSTETSPRTSIIFEHILYLPIPSRTFSVADEMTMLRALNGAISEEEPRKSISSHNNRQKKMDGLRRRKKNVFAMLARSGAFLGLTYFEWVFSVVGLFQNQLVGCACNAVLRIAPLLFMLIAIFFAITLLLCQFMGPVYLKSSDTFAKYCDMVFQSPFPDSKSEREDREDNFMQSKSVLKMPFTSVPQNCKDQQEGNDDMNMALLTGATGFVGSLLLRELLMHRFELMIPGGVVVIVRSKRGKSAKERIDKLLSDSMFDFLADNEKSSLVRIVDGDVTLPDCGIADTHIRSFRNLNISHVFHCAAAVSFSQPLEDAAVSNITSSLQMRSFTKQLRNKTAKFVYISTAFVHGGKTGSKTEPLPESLYDLHPYNPLDLYKSMLGTQSYASAAMNELGFPNTYTFSKCICEHLLDADKDDRTIIIRPSIVGPAVQEPFEGWAGERPSTIVAAACLYLKFPYNMWCFGKEIVPFVPVDVVCRAIVSRSFSSVSDVKTDSSEQFPGFDGEEKKDNSLTNGCPTMCAQNSIVNVAWDAASTESSSFSWLSYAYAITHLGSVCGHVNRVVAYAGLLLSTKIFPQLNFSLDTFHWLHSLLVRAPIAGLLHVCDNLPWKPEFARDLKIMGSVLDLPLVFFPFANQNFYFKSDLVSPSDFNGERYMFSCVVAAHRFIRIIEARRKKKTNRFNTTNFREYHNLQNCTSVIIAGENHVKPLSDLWWALTQPQGNMFIRFGGWILAKIFRRTATEIEIDVASFASLAKKLSEASNRARPHVIIAPTHRSFYDFLIVSYVCFALPELGLAMPRIAAASDFSRIPVIGWLANGALAFFLKRGGTKADPSLKKDLKKIMESPTFVEVFIEGKRSRHRTFIAPKTGFLKCLADIDGQHIVLPLTINYEGLPDQESLAEDANGSFNARMSLSALKNWIIRAFSGNVSVGRIYLSSSRTLKLPSSKHAEIRDLGFRIQRHQQSRVLVSNFHIQAASRALNLHPGVIAEALSSSGCTSWPEWREKDAILPIPESCDLQWTSMLHFGHALAPFFSHSHLQWSMWLCPSDEIPLGSIAPDGSVGTVVSKLAECFNAAEAAVDNSMSSLKEKGFLSPTENHVLQYLSSDERIPLFLMKVAIGMKAKDIKCTSAAQEKKICGGPQPLFQGSKRLQTKALFGNTNLEAFGAWGYRDSYFVLNIKRDGSQSVTMKGSRYSISGKDIPGLVKFIEDELRVTITPSSIASPSRPELLNIPTSALTSEALTQVRGCISNDDNRLSLDAADRARHGTGHTQDDMFNLRSGSIKIRLPDAVIWPKDKNEVQELVALATDNNFCLIPFGGGTNVTHSTHCPPKIVDPRPMISVDMKLMNRVLWINEEDGLAHVEAGVTGLELIQQMEKLGFTIGHEPDSYEFSTLGGWIATKASGMKQNKYGNIEDIVREVTVVGSKNTISQRHKMSKLSFGRVSTGVDLKSLMLGSEGCFGIITSAVIKIWPIAETRKFESVLLPNFDSGLKFVKEISKMRSMKPASVRLLDNDQFRLGQSLKEAPSKIESLRNTASKIIARYCGNYLDKSVVCATITFEGSQSEVQVQHDLVRKLAVSHGGILAGSRVGRAGYDLTFAIAYLRDFAMNYAILGESFETFVPWSKLTQVVDATKKKIRAEHSIRSLPGKPFVCSRITQLYDEGACVYFYFCMDSNGVPQPSDVFGDIEASARQVILDNGGSLSHHHGLGKLRSHFTNQIFSEGYIDSLIAMKKALDPSNTFGAKNGVFSNMIDYEKE